MTKDLVSVHEGFLLLWGHNLSTHVSGSTDLKVGYDPIRNS